MEWKYIQDGDTYQTTTNESEYLALIVLGYIEAVEWVEGEGEEVSAEARKCLRDDVKSFFTLAMHLLKDETMDPVQVGHDLWFTRNGHGVGFWEPSRGYIHADALTAIAEKFGERDVWIDHDTGEIELG